MKLFRANKLIKEINQECKTRGQEIVRLQKKNRELENTIFIKDETIDKLSEIIDDKDIRITNLYKEILEIKKENEGYLRTIKRAADENLKLIAEIEYLKSGVKAGAVSLPFKAEVSFVAQEELPNLTRVNGYKPVKEHVCTTKCFGKHVLPAIQKDLDSINPKYRKGKQASVEFLRHWYTRLKKEYGWLDYLYTVDGHIHFKSIF